MNFNLALKPLRFGNRWIINHVSVLPFKKNPSSAPSQSAHVCHHIQHDTIWILNFLLFSFTTKLFLVSLCFMLEARYYYKLRWMRTLLIFKMFETYKLLHYSEIYHSNIDKLQTLPSFLRSLSPINYITRRRMFSNFLSYPYQFLFGYDLFAFTLIKLEFTIETVLGLCNYFCFYTLQLNANWYRSTHVRGKFLLKQTRTLSAANHLTLELHKISINYLI